MTKLLLFFLFLYQITIFAQNPQENNKGIRVMFYNVENLFHPSNDSLKNDDEFTPKGQRYWSYKRYKQKLIHIAKTVIAVGEWEPPAVLGLCEIENIQCLEDLVNQSPIKKFGYKIIHYECADKRGIDVAMLYRPEFFTPVYSHPFVLNFGPDSRPTRDILYVKGVVNKSDTLHCFVNHWPSRYGGQLATAPKRENHMDFANANASCFVFAPTRCQTYNIGTGQGNAHAQGRAWQRTNKNTRRNNCSPTKRAGSNGK